MEIPKFIKGVAKYFTYASDSGETTPTTQADLQELMKNNNTILECLVDGLWQPEKEMKLNQIIRSPNMPANMIAQVTSAGTTGTTEPEWPSTVGSTITDSTVTYMMQHMNGVQTVNGVKADAAGNVNVKSLVNEQIYTAVDLNNYKTAGIYYCGDGTLANTIINLPIKTAFYLEIVNMTKNTKQVFTAFNPSNPRSYIRTYYEPNQEWGEWKEFAYKNDMPLIPVGIIMPFAGNGSIPDGWVICNGAAVSRSTYAALFAAIGTTYGTGNGSTTFNLPDLTNRFIEGSNTAGTVLAAGLPNITGNISAFKSSISGAFEGSNDTNRYDGWNDSQDEYAVSTSFDASRSNGIYGASSTVQPPALTMRFCIKY